MIEADRLIAGIDQQTIDTPRLLEALLRVRQGGGIVYLPAARAAPELCTVLRSWPDEPDARGYLRHGRKGWVFSYAPGEADDEAIFHLETHPLCLGEYVTITEPDGTHLCFHVAHSQPCDA